MALEFATLQTGILSVFFWIGVGGGLVSAIIFLFHHPRIRRKARLGIKHLLISGSLAAIALFIFTTAVSIGPVSLISALLEVQLLFVFIVVTILSVFHPKFLKEKITKSIIMQKLAAIALIIIGAVLIV